MQIQVRHLPKWQFQPVSRGGSWEVTIRNQRRALADHLADNPSLKAAFPLAVARAYADAGGEAYAETALPEVTFPAECVWRSEPIMAPDF